MATAGRRARLGSADSGRALDRDSGAGQPRRAGGVSGERAGGSRAVGRTAGDDRDRERRPGKYVRAAARAHPEVRWRFHAGPLGFAEAIERGLREVRHDWVYLLNSDVALDPQALCALAPHRDSRTFSIASQIVLKDPTRYREETNCGALLI